MNFPCSLVLLTAFPIAAFAQQLGENDPKPLPALEQLKRFKVPPGFEVQLVADETQIHKPINLNFDSAGRLWTSGSQHYPWPAATDAAGNRIPNFEKTYDEMANAFGAKGKAPPFSVEAKDTVRILSAFGPDGRAQKSVIFADKLNIPSGVQPLPATRGSKATSAVIYSIPNIWLMTDTDGDGAADKRDLLYGPFGFLDTHGGSSSYNYWIDGWIYGTHGFRNHSEVKDRAGKVTIFDSGNTYRFKPDGSKIEYWSRGQTNPFGLTFDPFGNLYSADCHSKPVYLLLRGGYYEGLGKQHDGLGFAPAITNDDHGSTGICGIAYYAAEQFPADYRDNIFIGNCVTGRINRDKLEWHGSTPKAIRQPDFLTCDDPWFRPVDIKLGPDGALYIADFYNYIIGHYENPLLDPRRDNSRGRIWRVIYRGEPKIQVSLPDLTSRNAQELAKTLEDSNLIVRTLATNELVERIGNDALPELRKILDAAISRNPGKDVALDRSEHQGAIQRAHACLAFYRLAAPKIAPRDYELFSQTRFRDKEIPRVLAFKLTADKRPWDDADAGLILEALTSGSPPVVKRAAWEALAFSPNDFLGPDPIELLRHLDEKDAQLVYQAKVALREYFTHPGALAHLAKTAIEQPIVIDALLGVTTPDAAQFLLDYLQRAKPSARRAGELVRHVALHLPQERFDAIGTVIRNLKAAPIGQQLNIADNLSRAMRQRGIKSDEVIQWADGVMLTALGSTEEGVLNRAIESVRELKLEAKAEPLARIARETKWAGPLRTAALDALANTERATEALIVALNDPSSMTLRKRAAELLAQKCAGPAPAAPGSAGDPCATLLAALPIAPWELATTIAAGLAKHEASCNELVALVETGKASAALLRHKTVAAPLAERSARLKERAAELTKDLPPEDARLDQLIAQRVTEYRAAKPDPSHGAQVFQQHCAVCHKVNNVGGSLAPNLDGMAARGLHRLLEDILDPNRNVDPAFAQVVIETKDGQMFAGVGPRVEGELIILNDAQGKPVSVSKAQVKTQTQSRLSLMPPTFEHLLSGNDLNDVTAFLLTQSAPPAK